jgi:hypothetical protein
LTVRIAAQQRGDAGEHTAFWFQINAAAKDASRSIALKRLNPQYKKNLRTA